MELPMFAASLDGLKIAYDCFSAGLDAFLMCGISGKCQE